MWVQVCLCMSVHDSQKDDNDDELTNAISGKLIHILHIIYVASDTVVPYE